MPSQLLSRLNPVFDVTQAMAVEQFEDEPLTAARHWPRLGGGFGDLMDVRSIVIHETSGWTSYESAAGFMQLYTNDPHRDFNHTLGDKDGVGPQFYVDANGTVFQLIGTAPDEIRKTGHATYLNNISMGIENGDLGDTPGLRPPQARFRAMPGSHFGDATVSILLHPDGEPDAILLWFVDAAYHGSGDAIPASWNRMLFSERDYRTLVLLCRFLAEALNIPRNFPMLPYEREAQNTTNVDIFRRLVLGDEHTDMFARGVGKTPVDFVTTPSPLSGWYNGFAGAAGGVAFNTAWRRFLTNELGGGYQGFLGHGFVGGGHDQCPGPLFDWHRFAHEVWDWWFYPFDFDKAANAPFQLFRPYLSANRTTHLQNYFFDTDAVEDDYTRLIMFSLAGLAATFLLPAATPLYAMANGLLVASRLVKNNGVNLNGFILTRHEVFFRTKGARIDYDRPPSYVYSLIYLFLHDQADFDNPSAKNPGWLNRFMVRLKETELAVQFQIANLAKAAAAQDHALTTGWNHLPTGGTNRLSTGDQIGNDAAHYRRDMDLAKNGDLVLWPLEQQTGVTPVRVILGDFLGVPGMAANGQPGSRIEIFSTEELPVANRQHDRAPAFAEDWWPEASGFLTLEGNSSGELPIDGMVWQYPMTDFLHWINDITWTSEWDKYDVRDAAGAKPARPAKPKSRRV